LRVPTSNRTVLISHSLWALCSLVEAQLFSKSSRESNRLLRRGGSSRGFCLQMPTLV
jgi:hypothetical protein